MKKYNRPYYEALEELEYYKLKEKYEALGYEFMDVLPEKIKGKVDPDALARHKDTGSLIFFEIKALSEENPFIKSEFVQQLTNLKASLPNARYILVIARPPSEYNFFIQELDEVLLKLIQEYYKEKFVKQIAGVVSFDSVEDLSITQVMFKKSKHRIEGFGNIKFLFEREDSEVMSSVTDGVPFKFILTQSNGVPLFPFWYLIDNVVYKSNKMRLDHKITFDFSEFIT